MENNVTEAVQIAMIVAQTEASRLEFYTSIRNILTVFVVALVFFVYTL